MGDVQIERIPQGLKYDDAAHRPDTQPPLLTFAYKSSPLKVKEVMVDERRYIVCLNERQARKDAADRQAIIASLEEKLKTNPKSLVGNKGYRKYLKLDRDSVAVDEKKIEEEARFDGKWVLKTNTSLTAEQTALRYKELWQVEQVFRDMKSILETRPDLPSAG